MMSSVLSSLMPAVANDDAATAADAVLSFGNDGGAALDTILDELDEMDAGASGEEAGSSELSDVLALLDAERETSQRKRSEAPCRLAASATQAEARAAAARATEEARS